MNLTFDSDFVRLDAADHQIIGNGPGANYDNGVISLRCDNKTRGIMVKIPADPWKFHENGDQYEHQIYIDVYINEADLPKANSVRVRLVRDTPWSLDDASFANWAEWDVLDQLSGGWNRVMIDPSKPHSQNAGNVTFDPRWRWAGVMFDIGNVSGKEPNVKISKVDVGSKITIQNDNLIESFDWDVLSQLDPFGVIKKTGPMEYFVRGHIEFESVKIESYDEFVTLYRSMNVGPGCSFKTVTGTTYGTHGKIDFSNALFVLLDRTVFDSVMGTPFDGYSIKFGPTTTLAACTINKCGLVVQNGSIFNGVDITNPQPQWNTFDLVKSYRKVSDTHLDGTDVMSRPQDEFTPFITFNDNNGDKYWVGAPVLFNKIYFEGDYLGGVSDHEWFYWAEGAGWTPLAVTGPSVRNLRGYINFQLQPDWQKLDGLYQIMVVIEGLFAVKPDPAHKYAFYVPAGIKGLI